MHSAMKTIIRRNCQLVFHLFVQLFISRSFPFLSSLLQYNLKEQSHHIPTELPCVLLAPKQENCRKITMIRFKSVLHDRACTFCNYVCNLLWRLCFNFSRNFQIIFDNIQGGKRVYSRRFWRWEEEGTHRHGDGAWSSYTLPWRTNVGIGRSYSQHFS